MRKKVQEKSEFAFSTATCIRPQYAIEQVDTAKTGVQGYSFLDEQYHAVRSCPPTEPDCIGRMHSFGSCIFMVACMWLFLNFVTAKR